MDKFDVWFRQNGRFHSIKDLNQRKQDQDIHVLLLTMNTKYTVPNLYI